MKIPVDLNRLKEVLNRIEQELSPLEPDVRFKILFTCEEILTNLVRHADFGNRLPEVTLALELADQQEVQLTCSDNGAPFDIRAFPDPQLDRRIEERRLGGLGIYLLKKYAKHIDYSSKQGCNILRITL
ncbi:MAG TPA: ATP-binding protein [Desulfobulbus sp.]|nr:ATP-binding protein [Desulfobulbus sp.]